MGAGVDGEMLDSDDGDGRVVAAGGSGGDASKGGAAEGPVKEGGTAPGLNAGGVRSGGAVSGGEPSAGPTGAPAGLFFNFNQSSIRTPTANSLKPRSL